MAAPGDDLREHLLVPIQAFPNIGGANSGLQSLQDATTHLQHQSKRARLHDKTMDIESTSSGGDMFNETPSAPKMSLGGTLSMAQFEAQFSAQHLAHKAAQAQAKAPEPTATKTTITPGLTELAARSSESIVQLNTRCQSLGIGLPTFTFTGTTSSSWTGQVNFPQLAVSELQNITTDTYYPSKQQVKEALSKEAYTLLEAAVARGEVRKEPKTSRTAGTSQSSVDLHDKCQKLGLSQPIFTYAGETAMGYTATANFPSLNVEELQNIKDETKFANKSLAKHATSKIALEALIKAEQEGKLGLKNVRVQQPLSEGGLKVPVVNYTGQLLEFQRATSGPQPIYRDFQNGLRFACLVEIEGFPQPFGSIDSLHTSKKAARQEAASHAIEYFKNQGLWPDNFNEAGGIRKKAKQSTLSNDTTNPSTLNPANAPFDSKASSTPGGANQSYAQKLMSLSLILALGTPEYNYAPSPLDRDFYTVTCSFPNASGVNAAAANIGPHGEVRHILGKKKAKEECARLTLQWAEEEYERRMAMSRAVMGDAQESEGEAEFEDALEEMKSHC